MKTQQKCIFGEGLTQKICASTLMGWSKLKNGRNLAFFKVLQAICYLTCWSFQILSWCKKLFNRDLRVWVGSWRSKLRLVRRDLGFSWLYAAYFLKFSATSLSPTPTCMKNYTQVLLCSSLRLSRAKARGTCDLNDISRVRDSQKSQVLGYLWLYITLSPPQLNQWSYGTGKVYLIIRYKQR